MNKDEWMASFWLLLIAGLAAYKSIKLPIGIMRDPGPGFLPLCLSIVIGALVVLNAIKESFSAGKGDKRLKRGSFHLGPNWKRAGAVAIITFFYVLIMWEFLGYLLATPIFLFSVMRVTGSTGFRASVIVSLLLTGFSYLIFKVFLQCALPESALKLALPI
jgi:putative tricarboxylic transport membrane protein